MSSMLSKSSSLSEKLEIVDINKISKIFDKKNFTNFKNCEEHIITDFGHFCEEKIAISTNSGYLFIKNLKKNDNKIYIRKIYEFNKIDCFVSFNNHIILIGKKGSVIFIDNLKIVNNQDLIQVNRITYQLNEEGKIFFIFFFRQQI